MKQTAYIDYAGYYFVVTGDYTPGLPETELNPSEAPLMEPTSIIIAKGAAAVDATELTQSVRVGTGSTLWDHLADLAANELSRGGV